MVDAVGAPMGCEFANFGVELYAGRGHVSYV